MCLLQEETDAEIKQLRKSLTFKAQASSFLPLLLLYKDKFVDD
jgi:hypothetical protein